MVTKVFLLEPSSTSILEIAYCSVIKYLFAEDYIRDEPSLSGKKVKMTMAVTSVTSPQAIEQRPRKSMANSLRRKQTATPPVSKRQERTSFASFTEDRNAVAQSFNDSKTSSYARPSAEEAIDDFISADNSPLEQANCHNYPFNVSMTNPASMLHGFICPCEGFRGWKQISVGGRAASRSFGDLRSFTKGFTWDAPAKSSPKLEKPKNEAGQSMVERLPMELLSKC